MAENKKNRLVNVRPIVLLSVLVLMASFILLYNNDFSNMLNRWEYSWSSYYYFVPIIFLCLLYRKRDVFRAFEQKTSNYGLLLIVLSGIIHFTGRQGDIETLTYTSIWISIAAAFLIWL